MTSSAPDDAEAAERAVMISDAMKKVLTSRWLWTLCYLALSATTLAVSIPLRHPQMWQVLALALAAIIQFVLSLVIAVTWYRHFRRLPNKDVSHDRP